MAKKQGVTTDFPYPRFGVAAAEEVPITGPTAEQVMAAQPINSQADLAQSGIIENTLGARLNKRAKDSQFEDMQEAYLALVARGKKGADIAYQGAPEAFQDPDIQQYLSSPEDVRWVDPQTGQFNFVDWSKQFHDDLTAYRKWKFEMGKQDAMTARQDRRDAASMERARMANEIAKERNKISWANNALANKNFRLSQTKEINDQLNRAQDFLISKGLFQQKIITPRFDKWTNQPIPLTDEEVTQAQSVLQAYDQALLEAENEARWVQPSSDPGQRYQYQPSVPAPAGMVPVGEPLPPSRSTTPAAWPTPAPAGAPAPAAAPGEPAAAKPLTPEAVQKAARMFPGNKAAAMQWLQSKGYNINE